jgi:hypothetical protein
VEILDQLPVDLMDLPSGVYTVGRNLQPCVYWYGHDYVPSPVEAAEIEKAAPPLYANLLRVYYIQQGVDIASDKHVRDRTLSFVIRDIPGKGLSFVVIVRLKVTKAWGVDGNAVQHHCPPRIERSALSSRLCAGGQRNIMSDHINILDLYLHKTRTYITMPFR